MSRPEVSVVVPFAGDVNQARDAVTGLLSLHTSPGDQLILADNSGPATAAGPVQVIRVPGERSPAHARNTGAAHARTEWILFLDADCLPAPDLLDAYFAHPISDDVGALAGEVRSAAGARTLVARYGAARGFLSQQAHLEHPFRPRAVAANLLVRREAFEQLGGFFEGVRAAEDTDLSWRLQEQGWRLELRPEAWVEHRYRTTLRELRTQWRGYAAGRAWLARRYEGFEPQPAMARAWERSRSRLRRRPASRRSAPAAGRAVPRIERGSFLALDALLSLEELAGLASSNRPPTPAARSSPDAVLVADRFPARDDPLVELAQTLDQVRVEAMARPAVPDLGALRKVPVDYMEDDGWGTREAAALALVFRHPLRCARDRLRRGPDGPPLRVLAPAVLRLERDAEARLHSLGGDTARRTAVRLAGLAGRVLQG